MATKAHWNVIGHQPIIDFLFTSLVNGKIAHSYLFLGEEGLGKETVAQLFFQSILCSKNVDKEKVSRLPCDNCEACLNFKNGKFNDYFLLKKEEDKTLISIEQVRQLLHFISLRPSSASYKFILIKRVEDLSLEAANSLLKILEEPPPQTVFILISENEDILPQTVVSRSQIIRFNLVATQEIYQYLTKQGKTASMARVLANLAQGRPGLAIQFAHDKENYEQYQAKMELFTKILKSSLAGKFDAIKEVKAFWLTGEGVRKNLYNDFSLWQVVLRDGLLSQLSLSNLVSNGAKNSLYKQTFTVSKQSEIIRAIRSTFFSQRLVKQNINPQLILENFLLNLNF